MAANAPSRSNRNAHVALKSRPLEPLQTYHPSSNVNIEDRTLSSMANNADADYVEELDIDQELRSRNQRSKSTPQAPIYTPQQSSKSGASSRSIESDREDAPLLSPTERDYGQPVRMGGRGRLQRTLLVESSICKRTMVHVTHG
jgi:hypothetical protein